MPEQMYFFVVGEDSSTSAQVVREYADGKPIAQVRPSNTIFEIEASVDFGDEGQWNEINRTLEQTAHDLGITNISNLYPPPDMQEIVRRGAAIRNSPAK